MIDASDERSYHRRMRRICTMLAVLVASLLLTATAEAAKTKTYAPPGKAGTSQYSEVVPTAGGNVQPPSSGGGNRTAAQISVLGHGKQGVRKLASLGKQGKQAAQFAQATAPEVIHSTHGFGGEPAATAPATQSGSSTLAAGNGGSALSGIGHLIGGSDGGGIGVFLPLLLAFGLGAAAAFAIVKLRRRGPASPPA